MHGDHITRLGEIRPALDRAERCLPTAGVAVFAGYGDMKLGGVERGWRRQHNCDHPTQHDESICNLLISLCF
jgi:hypothetical protein